MFEMEGICQAVRGERRLLFSVKLSEMLSLWACSHSSFPLLALNVGRFVENESRTDKEPSTMACGSRANQDSCRLDGALAVSLVSVYSLP